MCCSPVCCDFFLVLLAVVFPPLPVWIKTGVCTVDSFINIALCILGFLPGLFHSWYIISKYPKNEHVYYEDIERQAGRFHDQNSACHYHHHHTHTVYVPVGYGTMDQQQQTEPSSQPSSSSLPNESPPRYSDIAPK
ncbi:hypothetical protein TRICI_000678 [Trichomonascus ciferrii]|uniref:Stress response RCI peptide n=1 Tax=Trichomonascus ciferrii TaxID=44093 RepID=A0A642VCV5_9ASCO|nr:hypothetical protein TRICI_000678 [Trichomonascus ciferrii]